MNKESLIALYTSKDGNKKVNYYSFPLIKKERWLKGAKTKYDIPQYIEGIPEGFAIFCTTKEAGKVRKYQEQIERKNKMKKLKELNCKIDNIKKNEDLNREVEDMDVINKRLITGAINNLYKKEEEKKIEENEMDIECENNDESITKELQEPLPRNEHKYCYICKTKIEKYIKHIKSRGHFENLSKHQSLFNKIKKSFEKINNFWNINIKKNNSNINSKIGREKFRRILLSSKESTEISMREGNSQNKNKDYLIKSLNMNENINNNEIFRCNNLIKNSSKLNGFNKYDINSLNQKIIHSSGNRNILNKSCNEHIINLTNNKNINKNIFNSIIKDSIKKENPIKTMDYINIKNNEEKIIKTFNDNKIHLCKEEPKKKFVTKCYPKFATLQTFTLPKVKKRKKNEVIKSGELFVINTPKRIDYDYFPALNVDMQKKLINRTILFFK